VFFGQLINKDNVIGLVDEKSQLPQKLVLRTVRFEYTKLAENSVICGKKTFLCALCVLCLPCVARRAKRGG
jgi:hypothetical protein